MVNSTQVKKNYVKGSAKLKQFSDGELVNVDLNLESINALPANEAGYVKIVLRKLPAPDKFGNDYSIYENTWKPDPSKKPLPDSGKGESKSTNKLPF